MSKQTSNSDGETTWSAQSCNFKKYISGGIPKKATKGTENCLTRSLKIWLEILHERKVSKANQPEGKVSKENQPEGKVNQESKEQGKKGKAVAWTFNM